RTRAGTTFSRQVGLGQVRRSAAQHLVLLLQQAYSPLGLAQLTRLGRRGAGFDPGLHGGFSNPLLQRHGVGREVGGALLERQTVFTAWATRTTSSRNSWG